MDDQCIICNIQVRARQEGLQCDACSRWQHRTCNTGISRDQYRQAVRGLIELEWKCSGCEQIVTNDVPEDTSLVVERSFDIPEAIGEQSIHDEETIGDIPTDEPLRYGIVETGSIRGKRKLVDTDGFSYTVKNTKDDHTLWRCSKRSKTMNCPATVVQDGAHYKPGLKIHVHPAEPGSIIAIRIKAEVKAQANQTVFGKSARTIVESVMREESDLAAPEGSRPSQTNLIRAANRLRQGLRPADPVDMDSETAYNQKDAVYQYLRQVMALPFLPQEHIREVFDSLDEKATNDKLDAIMVYIYNTWIRSTIFPIESWCIFMRSVRTNNDVEGWHNRLNSRVATRGPVPFYLLVLELYKEATDIPLQIKLLSEGKLQRQQRKKTVAIQGKVFSLWDKYCDRDISATRLLRECASIYGPPAV